MAQGQHFCCHSYQSLEQNKRKSKSHPVLSEDGVMVLGPTSTSTSTSFTMCTGWRRGHDDVTQGWPCRLIDSGAKCQAARASHCSSVRPEAEGCPTNFSRNFLENSANKKKKTQKQ